MYSDLEPGVSQLSLLRTHEISDMDPARYLYSVNLYYRTNLSHIDLDMPKIMVISNIRLVHSQCRAITNTMFLRHVEC